MPMPNHTSKREPLLGDRRGSSIVLTLGAMEITFTINVYEDGRPGEVFVHVFSPSTLGVAAPETDSLLHALARSVSLGLQYGVPVEVYIEQLRHIRSDVAGFVTGHAQIRYARSIPDLLAQWLRIKFMPEMEDADVKKAISESA